MFGKFIEDEGAGEEGSSLSFYIRGLTSYHNML